ncbi:hypothetical protein [Streptacidiphilus jiangxiensis]|uniref:HD/PDEase domain-containing protein n=1 Tax=Streptacidiphilus jiangxiensis TaxID=235985 RepID=A0A1H8AAX3_STRJI|nr:hypothetical protein [Streptacidiphilus jiangxiensis]SEM67860.1 hypothetical protein SAMN05414137_1438 [Streptacidiphilus jiangxiensis]
MTASDLLPAGPTLRTLALAGQLPDHQALDRQTLSWIACNRPPQTEPRPRDLDRPALFVPARAWFARPQAAESIHGVRHGARVALLVQLLAPAHGVEPGRARALAGAAACHDCRRQGDRTDPGHGRRAADWLTGQADAVVGVFGTEFTDEVLTAVALHDVAHPDFTDQQAGAYRLHHQAVDLLKAADALDRYRLPLERWWSDPARLTRPVPNWAPPLAHDLVVHSEQARLDGATDEHALRQALDAVLPA